MKTLKEKTVKIADLKSHLSEHLRTVRSGNPITLMDRNTPIARILPYKNEAGRISIRKPIRSFDSYHPPSPLAKRTDSLSILMEERLSGR
jgi:prevent-host-death family protein